MSTNKISKLSGLGPGYRFARFLPALVLLGFILPGAPVSSQVPPPPPTTTPPVVFTKQGVTPGLVITENESLKMNMTIKVMMGSVPAGQFSMSEDDEKDKLIKVLKADTKGAPMEVEVNYRKSSSVSVEQGQRKVGTRPTQGKTYVVTSDGSVRYAAGQTPPPAEEAQAVKKDFANMGKSFIIDELAGKSFTEGQKVPELEAVLRRYAGSDDEVKVSDGEVIFKGTRACGGETCGVFGVAMKMAGVFEESLRMEVPLSGEIVVRVNGAWPVKLALSGPIKVSGGKEVEGRKMVLTGGGQMNIGYSYTYK